MTLAQLKIGEKGVVRGMSDADECTMRLMEMGLTPGTTVHVNRVAPLGDPLHLSLRGYNLSIRKSEAQRVEIEPVSPSAAVGKAKPN